MAAAKVLAKGAVAKVVVGLAAVAQVVTEELAVTVQQILALAEAQEFQVENQALVVLVLLSFVLNFNRG